MNLGYLINFNSRPIHVIFCINLETTTIKITSFEEKEREQRHRELVEETVAVGIMFASKAFVQLLANPIVGPLTHKFVY